MKTDLGVPPPRTTTYRIARKASTSLKRATSQGGSAPPATRFVRVERRKIGEADESRVWFAVVVVFAVVPRCTVDNCELAVVCTHAAGRLLPRLVRGAAWMVDRSSWRSLW